MGNDGGAMAGVLEGIRVLDFGRYIAGPYCATLLAEHGAEVIRIEKREGSEDRTLIPLRHEADGRPVAHPIAHDGAVLGAGAILKSTGLRNLNEMGGLIRYLPHTALYFLIGAVMWWQWSRFARRWEYAGRNRRIEDSVAGDDA